ncbi:MAG: hypothetical protein Q4E36_02625 [Bacillota bacterium]|nr:hypothetical protein [Bacillota bacterium]
MKKLFLTLALMLVLTSCNQSPAKEDPKANEEVAATTENQEAAAETEEKGASESDFMASIDKSLISQGELDLAKEIDSAYVENFIIFLNTDAFEFTLKQRNSEDYNLVADAVKAHTYEESTDLADWDGFVESVVNASKAYEGKEETRQPIIKVLNPFYAKSALLVVKDGQVLYNFAEEAPKGDAGSEGMALDQVEELVK